MVLILFDEAPEGFAVPSTANFSVSHERKRKRGCQGPCFCGINNFGVVYQPSLTLPFPPFHPHHQDPLGPRRHPRPSPQCPRAGRRG